MITAVVTNGIGAVCAAAVLWFAYYRETKTIPALMQTFAEAHSRSLETFALAQRSANESYEGRQGKLLDTFARVNSEERATCQKWHEENRESLMRIAAETRENRHYIRDLAHQIGLRRAVDEERAKRGHQGDDDQ